MARVEGTGALKRFLQNLPREMRRELEKEAEKSAKEMLAAQQTLVPRDTGALADSFRIVPLEGENVGVSLEVQNWKARFQEFGTQHHAAQPFFYPIVRTWRRRYRARMSRAVRRVFG